MDVRRITTLIGKELREFRANPAAILPVLILIVVCVALPLLMLVLPRLMGAPDLSTDPGFLSCRRW